MLYYHKESYCLLKYTKAIPVRDILHISWEVVVIVRQYVATEATTPVSQNNHWFFAVLSDSLQPHTQISNLTTSTSWLANVRIWQIVPYTTAKIASQQQNFLISNHG